MGSSPPTAALRVLILGGSSEATALARALAGRADIATELSLAGRTLVPLAQPVPVRIGGFGGAEGLAAYLERHRVDLLVDALHPFATRMAANAREAARRSGRRLIAVKRLPWAPRDGDEWQEVADMIAAAAAIGVAPRRALLTVGRLQLAAFARAPHHRYLVRTVDPVGPDHGLADAVFIEACGPFAIADERVLMKAHCIDVLVTKNSGGEATRAKLDAARELGLPVILVRAPASPNVEGTVGSVAEAMAAIESHCPMARRGV